MSTQTQARLLSENEALRQRVATLEKELMTKRNAEVLLQKSETQFRALVTASSEVLYRMSPDWKTMSQLQNQDFLADTEEPNSNWLEKYIHPDDQAFVFSKIEQAIQSKSIFELEHRVRQADGRWGWTYSRAIPILDPQGEIIEWFGAASSFTKRKQAEDALRQAQAELEARVQERTAELTQVNAALQASRATLQSFYDSAPFMMGIAELDGDKIVAVSGNRATADFFTTSAENLPGRTGLELGTPDNLEQMWLENYQHCQQEGLPVRFEYEYPHLGGNRWLRATMAFIGIGAAGLPRFSFAVEDFTAHKHAEEALRENEERQTFLLSLSDLLRPVADPAKIQEIVTRSTLDHYKADRCYYCEIVNGQAIIRQDASRGDLSSVAGAYPLSDFPIFKTVVDAGRTFTVENVQTTDLLDEPLRQLCIQLQLYSFVDVPVIKQGQPVGILCITQCTVREWTDFEIKLSEEIAERTWEAVERQHTEEALRESEMRLSTIMQNLPVGIWVVDAAGKVTTKNAAADLIWAGDVPLSSSSEDYVEYIAWDVITGKQLEADDYPLAKTLQTGLPIGPLELGIRRFNGTEGFILISTVPLPNPDGSLTGAVGINIDITERKRAEEALQRMNKELGKRVTKSTAELRASDARIQSIFMDSPLGMALLNPAGEILASNPALQKMLGYNAGELRGKPFDVYSHPDDAAEDAALHRALLSVETGHYRAEKRYVRRDGQVRWSELTMSRVPARNGDAGFAFAMLADITEKKLDQEALLRTERLAIIGRLGASLAHEINNPLQAALGCLGLAEESIEDGKIKNYLQIALEELDRAAGIVSHLRDLGRPSEPKKKELADLNAILERTLILMHKRCESQSIRVEWHPAPGLPQIPVVADTIQQVFLNLILNAIEALNGKGGVLQVMNEPTLQPAGISVTITDTGRGIEAERLPHIFDPFYSTRPNGMGLGLYISKKIVDSHGGHLEVKSQPGIGSTFTVWLPR